MNKEYVHKKAESSETDASASHLLQSRAFAVQARSEAGVKEQVETAPRSENLLGRVRVSQRTAIQPKLAIGTPGDRYEREADAIAEGVMNAPERAIAANITPIGSGDAIQNKGAGEGSAPAGGSHLESQLNQSNTSGTPLPPQVRAFMEPRIGADFSAVRVHTDARAAQMNRQLGAQAFTYGDRIYYGAGKSPSNDALTAHELIHVEQQTGNGGARSAGSIQRQVVQAQTDESDPWSSAELQDNPELTAGAKQGGAKFSKVKKVPLFPEGKDPSPEDVQQAGLGDCYLEASLASLAAEKPDYIKEMMRDNGDGTVTVRLYSVDQTDMRKHTFTPKYIRVEKSVVTHVNQEGKKVSTYNRGALWAHMVQKAYAAGGFTANAEAPKTPEPSYTNITDNGIVRYALEVLLGHQSQFTRLQGSVLYYGDDIDYFDKVNIKGFKGETNVEADFVSRRVPWDKATVQMYKNVKSKTPRNYSPLANLRHIFKTKAKIDSWMAFVEQGKIEELFKKEMQNRAQYISSQLTLSDFETLFEGKDFKDDIMKWLQSQKLVPGDLGTAIYSKMQLNEFEKIKKALDRGQIVAANTNTIITEGKAAGVGASGEQIASGLAGGHAFSILGYRKNASTNPDDENATGKFYWLKLRNPWGYTGRQYKFSTNGGEGFEDKNNKTGIFWLELSDLTRYFSIVSFG